MLHEYTRTKSESLAQIITTMAEIQDFFKGIVFIGAPCTAEMVLCRENHISYTGTEICTYHIKISEAVLDSLVLTVMACGLHDTLLSRI